MRLLKEEMVRHKTGGNMLRIKMKRCKKCGKLYTWKSGGIVATPKDFMDFGMCTRCRVRYVKEIKT